jgi:hypothetical protein
MTEVGPNVTNSQMSLLAMETAVGRLAESDKRADLSEVAERVYEYQTSIP